MESCCGNPLTTTIKQGSTFTFGGQLYGDDGLPLSLSGMALLSQVRDSSGELIEQLSTVIPDQTINPGLFFLNASGVINWPIDELRCDIEVSSAGIIEITNTIYIVVEEAITQ